MAYANRSSLPTPAIEHGVSVANEFLLATVYLAKSVRFSVAAIGIVAILSLPLYAMGYHQGALPIIGLSVAMGLGALSSNLILALAIRANERHFFERSLRPGLIVYPLIIAVVMAPMFFGVVNISYATFGPIVEPVSTWVANNQAYAWKPFWHMGLGSLLALGMAPLLAILWPLQMRSRLPVSEAMVYLWKRIENVYYSGLSVRLVVLVTAFFVAPLPYLCIVLPVIVAAFQIRLYRRIF